MLAGTGPVGMRAAALLGKEGADVTITSRTQKKTDDAAKAIEKRFGVKVKAVEAADDASRAAAVKDANIVFAAGAIGVQLLPLSAWKDNPNIECVADVNAQPPLGIEGIEATDKGKDRYGKLAFGALGIGGLKLKLHRACIGKLFESSDSRVRRRGDLRARQGDGLRRMIKRHRDRADFSTSWRAERDAGRRQRRRHHRRHGRGPRRHGVQPHHRQEEICRGRRRDEHVLAKAEALRHGSPA